MTIDSMEELKAAFDKWRSGKVHKHEKTPEELVHRAREATKTYGVGQVLRALNIHKRQLRLLPKRGGINGKRPSKGAKPSYSKIDLMGPVANRLFAEFEMPSGMKLRLYSQTRETMEFLSSVCGAGGGR